MCIYIYMLCIEESNIVFHKERRSRLSRSHIMMSARSHPLMASSFSSVNGLLALVVPAPEDLTHYVAVQGSDPYRAISASNSKPMTYSPEIDQDIAKKAEKEGPVEKCALKIQVIDDTALIEPERSHVRNGNGDNRQEIRERERKPKRKGTGRKKKEPKNEGKKRYSRKEMQDMRFVDLEYQKNKWVQVYCGFGASVAHEYNGLVKSDYINPSRTLPDFNFAPRPRARKSAVDAVAALGKELNLNIIVR